MKAKDGGPLPGHTLSSALPPPHLPCSQLAHCESSQGLPWIWGAGRAPEGYGFSSIGREGLLGASVTRPNEKPVFSVSDHMTFIVPTSSWRLEGGSLMMLSKPETSPCTARAVAATELTGKVRQGQQEGSDFLLSSPCCLGTHPPVPPSFRNVPRMAFPHTC